MQATVKQLQGVHSSKPAIGSAAASPLKRSPDSMQNGSSNIPSQTKRRKRERVGQSSEPIKRDRSVRGNGGDSSQLISENLLKLEIAKIAEKGLIDCETVEGLVQLMQPEKPEMKIDLTERSMLAGIVAATDNADCLDQFVQLRGLPVFDKWLQEVHKGKIRGAGNLNDGDTSVEDFLLVLLCALDKLPVNLDALQMCNIGKSVNHLRSHKNAEIQKKARSLVHMWKKRVEAEMNIDDAKSGSSQAVAWSGRSRHDSHGGNRHSSGSSESAIRSSVTHHSSLKSTSAKLVQGDSPSKLASVYPGGARSAFSLSSTSANYKDGLCSVSAGPELPQVTMREEKSGSSSQSHSNSQCSSDHVRNMVPSGKENARSSTAGSRSSNKMTGSGSRLQKSANDRKNTPSGGVKLEIMPNRGSSVARTTVTEKVFDNVNAVDASAHETNNHKFIVKIPYRGHSAVLRIAGGPVEDYSCRNSRGSSPALSEKHEQFDACSKEKGDCHHSTEVDGSLNPVLHRCRTRNVNGRLLNVSKVSSSPSRNELKPKKALDSSFSSMNALVESCVQLEANAAMSAGDDVGMNLLASVATGEIPKFATVSPSVSPHRTSAGEGFIEQQCQSSSIADADKHNTVASVSKFDEEAIHHHSSPDKIQPQNEEGCLKSNGKLDEQVGTVSLQISPAFSEVKGVADGIAEIRNGKTATLKEESLNEFPVASQGRSDSLTTDYVEDASSNKEPEKGNAADTMICRSSNVDDKKIIVNQGLTLDRGLVGLGVLALQSESKNTSVRTPVVSLITGQNLATKNSNEVKPGKTCGKDFSIHIGLIGNGKVDQENDPSLIPLKQEEPGLSSFDTEKKVICRDENLENKAALAHQYGKPVEQDNSPAVDHQKPELHLGTEEFNNTAANEERKDEDLSVTGIAAVSPGAGGSDIVTKLGFDLNEGFSMDDERSDEPDHLGAGPCIATLCSVSPSQLPVSSAPGCFPASVTVAAAAKGPFVPLDDLLRNKMELGWEGSAIASAFHPTEPRKTVEVPLGPFQPSLPVDPARKLARSPLDIDLNVADERILHDFGCLTTDKESNDGNSSVCELMIPSSFRCSGGLDLDLNKVDEAADLEQLSATNGQRLEVLCPVKASSSIFSNHKASRRRDFDLNNGPATEEVPFGQRSYHQHGGSNTLDQTPFGPRINNSETGNCFPWHPSGPSYSVSMTPSALSDREVFPIVAIGSGSQRVITGPTSNLQINHDSYRGSMLSSAPAIPYHSTTFQYPVFPFGGTFPLPTSALSDWSSGFMDPAAVGRIPGIPSQLVGTAAAVPFQYPHAYVVSPPIPNVSTNVVVESNQKLGKQGLDLKSDFRGVDTEGRGESMPTVSRQLSTISSISLAEEQARMYNMAGGILKRKEPEAGWTMDKVNLKQSSWR